MISISSNLSTVNCQLINFHHTNFSTFFLCLNEQKKWSIFEFELLKSVWKEFLFNYCTINIWFIGLIELEKLNEFEMSSELDQLRQEAEALKNQIRVSLYDYSLLLFGSNCFKFLKLLGCTQSSMRYNSSTKCTIARADRSNTDARTTNTARPFGQDLRHALGLGFA